VCVTYTMKGIMCAVVVKWMSTDTLSTIKKGYCPTN
jgi:hypothetical protein